MEIILGKSVAVKSYSRHLNAFCGDARGFVLNKNESTKRYRFKNPLMQPFVIIYGVAKGLIDEAELNNIIESPL